MPVVNVTKIDQSKNGKTRVYFNGNHAWKDAFYLGRDTPAPDEGTTIEANTTSKTWQDGSVSWFLNGWKLAAGTVAVPPSSSSVKSQGWNIDSGDLSRLASNLMASAIAAGLVKEPGQLMVWAAGAYRAAESLRSGKIEDFNDSQNDVGRDYVDPGEREDESDGEPF